MITSSTFDAAVGTVIDRAAVVERFDGDLELLREVADLFLGDCPHRLAAIRDALDRDDRRALQLAAHSLKGSVANFVASAAVTLALRLETMGRDGDLTDAAAVYAALEHEIARLLPFLLELKGSEDTHVRAEH